MIKWTVLISFITSILILIIILQLKSGQPTQNIKTNNLSEIIISPTTFEYIIITETPVPTLTPRPTPIPTKMPTPAIKLKQLSPQILDQLFSKYSENYTVDRELLRKIAVCESYLNPMASSGDFAGLYQFSKLTWITTRQHMNVNADTYLRYDPEEAIMTAAFKLKKDGKNSWPNCSR